MSLASLVEAFVRLVVAQESQSPRGSVLMISWTPQTAMQFFLHVLAGIKDAAVLYNEGLDP
jgi:hypothetical protein